MSCIPIGVEIPAGFDDLFTEEALARLDEAETIINDIDKHGGRFNAWKYITLQGARWHMEKIVKRLMEKINPDDPANQAVLREMLAAIDKIDIGIARIEKGC